VSKERARARAAREAEAAQRTAAEAERRERLAARQNRRERRDLAWRRMRLWQHGSGYRRRKEGIAALLTLDLVVLLLTYLLTSSVGAVFLVLLVLLVATPALAMLTLDTRHSRRPR
jgi:Flp pilus assembly protein TadB